MFNTNLIMKKVCLLVLVATLSLLVFLNFRTYAYENDMDLTTLENIEILTSSENGELVRCFSTGSLDCPATPVKVKMIW